MKSAQLGVTRQFKAPFHARNSHNILRLTQTLVPHQVLLTNTSLSRLVVRRSGVAAGGSTAIAAALRNHPCLEELDLMDNPEVGDQRLNAAICVHGGCLS